MFTDNDIKLHMEDSQKIFVAGIKSLIDKKTADRKKRGKKKLTVGEVADKINVSPSNLSGFLNFHRNYSEDKRQELSDYFGMKYVEVLNLGTAVLSGVVNITLPTPTMTGKATATPQQCTKEDCPLSFQDAQDKEHSIIIKGFIDKETAKQVNAKLVKLEKLSPERYKAALEQIDFQFKMALEETGDQKKTGTAGQQI